QRAPFDRNATADLDKCGEPDAAQAALRLRFAAALRKDAPLSQAERLREHLRIITAVVGGTQRCRIREARRRHQVAPAQRVRCQAETPSRLVDESLERERRLRLA